MCFWLFFNERIENWLILTSFLSTSNCKDKHSLHEWMEAAVQNTAIAKTASLHYSTGHREVKTKKSKNKNQHSPYPFPSRHSAASQKSDIVMVFAAPSLSSVRMLWEMTDVRSSSTTAAPSAAKQSRPLCHCSAGSKAPVIHRHKLKPKEKKLFTFSYCKSH